MKKKKFGIIFTTIILVVVISIYYYNIKKLYGNDKDSIVKVIKSPMKIKTEKRHTKIDPAKSV
ncbi:hypothetical protein V7152_09740 [Neobacillus drentensis]|uniref:hypothetical protein n=1 Tax=Neobacillus drentensis TaxID=220684 RepID=UPI00300031D3